MKKQICLHHILLQIGGGGGTYRNFLNIEGSFWRLEFGKNINFGFLNPKAVWTLLMPNTWVINQTT
jgi:hypothetical protein